MERVNLQGAILSSANLKNCNLRGANLQGANLGGTKFEESIFRSVTIDKNNVSNLPGRILEKYESTFLIV